MTSIITGNQNERVLISQNATSKPIERRGGTQKPPHAFTRDNFVDDRILTLLDKRDDEVEATIHTRYNESFLIDLRKHNDQYSEIKMASGATVLVSETYGIEL